MAAAQPQSFYARNPHELKDHDYGDEGLCMSEASEEGTAVDYDSQVEASGEQNRPVRLASNLK